MAPAKLDALRRNCLDYVAQRKPLILNKNLYFGDKPLGDKDKNQKKKQNTERINYLLHFSPM